ncbi:MAG TPA: hypothetical protein VLA36_13680 [Longimicrobiales bacterium]|nr:hypothetical protein [Longimicrobiales bacterium]
MFTNYRAALSVLVSASTLYACGGTVESAEQPEGADVPVVESSTPMAEAAAPEAEVAAPTQAEEPVVPAAKPAPAKMPAAVEPSAPAQPVVAPARVVEVGTTLTLVLDQTLSTESNKAGDPFTAHLIADFLAPDGEVLLPAGTSVRGVVTEAQESPSADAPAMLRLQIVETQVAGVAMPLVADVEEMQLKAEAKDSDRRTAGKVAVGAAAGALLGKALGKSGTKGAVVGAAAGAVVAVTTRDGHARLPVGAQMTIRLVEPLVIR